MRSTREIAAALGGQVAGPSTVLCPGPGHSAQDRSLAVRLHQSAPDGFLVHSHAGDDWRACREPAEAEKRVQTTRTKKKEQKSVRVFRDAFTDAIDTTGQTIHVRSDGPAVRAPAKAIQLSAPTLSGKPSTEHWTSCPTDSSRPGYKGKPNGSGCSPTSERTRVGNSSA
jgi:hypothetical protein